VAIAKRIEAGRWAAIAGLCDSPLTLHLKAPAAALAFDPINLSRLWKDQAEAARLQHLP
jgi:hypothetical protein